MGSIIDDHLEEAALQQQVHVFDLPQLYQRPEASELRQALNLLQEAPPSWSNGKSATCAVAAEGVTDYLTRFVASSLKWLQSDEEREEIWELASRRLAERSGRTAMGDMKRRFTVLVSAANMSLITAEIELNEPALTEDNLGFKTWGSSFILAKRLHEMRAPVMQHMNGQIHPHDRSTVPQDVPQVLPAAPGVLELGSGTGLVGIAAAAAWQRHVILTDLPEIMANLSYNVELNRSLLNLRGAHCTCMALDWNEPEQLLTLEDAGSPSRPMLTMTEHHTFSTILAADPIYSPEHPRLLVQTVSRWLEKGADSRFILAHPIRKAYLPQIKELYRRLAECGLTTTYKRTEVARDDWADDVTVVCSVWQWAQHIDIRHKEQTDIEVDIEESIRLE